MSSHFEPSQFFRWKTIFYQLFYVFIGFIVAIFVAVRQVVSVDLFEDMHSGI